LAPEYHVLKIYLYFTCGWRSTGCSVSIVTRLRTGRLGFNSWKEQWCHLPSVPHRVQTGYEAHPATYPLCTGGRTAEAWSCPLTSRDKRETSADVNNAWSYTSTPIHLRRDNFNSQLYTLYTLNGRISNCNCGHSIGKDVEGRDLRLFCGNLLSQHLPTRTKERHKSQLR